MFLGKVNISNGGSFPPAEHVIELSSTEQERLSYAEQQIYPKTVVPFNNKGLYFAHILCPLGAGYRLYSTLLIFRPLLRSMAIFHDRGKELWGVSNQQLNVPVQKHMLISTELIDQN